MVSEEKRQRGSRRVRVMPTLLIDRDGRLIKTVKFGKRTYIGDPINAVKIFNRKEVDELILFDIDASVDRREPNYALIEDIVSEAFMPVGYGGGIHTLDHIVKLYACGLEKVVLTSALKDGTALIEEAARRFGSQAIVACLPVKKPLLRSHGVFVRSGRQALDDGPVALAEKVVTAGAGEIILYAIDRDGTYQGLDIDLIRHVSDAVDIPVVACGGASDIEDMRRAIVEGGASAVAAGSLFVYSAPGKGVLISYPSQERLTAELFSLLRN